MRAVIDAFTGRWRQPSLGAGQLPLTSRGVQGAQAAVAVGLERAHAECLGQSQGLLVVRFGPHDVRGIGAGLDNAKLVQRAPRSRVR
jgi:hypothetical protein